MITGEGGYKCLVFDLDCVCVSVCQRSIVLDENEYVCTHAYSNLYKVARDKIFSNKLPLSSRKKVRGFFQLN